MRTSVSILVFTTALTLTPGFASAADEEDHAAHHPPSAAPAEAAPPAAHDHDKSGPNLLQDGMQRIEDLMQQIRDASDADTRHALLVEHLQAMRDQMKLVRDQARGAKTAMNPKERKEGGMEGMMKGGGMMQKHKQVEGRLDMLERLLQQSLEREAVEATMDER